MSQPSVAAYFNERKRAAVEDSKINRARKVLIVDEGKVKPINSLNETNNIEEETVKLLPNKIVNKSEASNSLLKKVVKPKIQAKRKIDTKGQQSLKECVNKLNNASVTKISEHEQSKEYITPPSSPLKVEKPSPVIVENAMDKISIKSKESLNAIKLKLSRSTRLAELKSSLLRFNESNNKLKEIEKITSKISASPKESPKLKTFRKIELEVNLSPQKFQSPEKQYLSPKKDVTARKNLLNLLSPTKNSVSLSESPSKKIYELTSKPALSLPFKYRYIAEIFRAIDTICQLLYNRKETITMTKLKAAVEKMVKRNLTSRCLKQIKHLYPDAFEFHQEKIRIFGTGKREEKWDLVLVPLIGGSDHMTSDILLTRKRILFNLLLEKVKHFHDEFLSNLEPPMIIPKDKITRWHPEFDIERVPDIEEDKLPEPPEEQKLTTGQEVLEKAREMFNCNSRMEQALERLKAKKEEAGVEKIEDTPPSSILKGIPKALLEKVRQKQAAKALISMTRSADKEQELLIYSRLPELARLTRNLFVSEKKSVLPLDIVVEKLGNCYKITLTKTEMENQIKLLAKELPDWMVLHNIRNVEYVKIDKRADLSLIIDKLEKLTKLKSEPLQ